MKSQKWENKDFGIAKHITDPRNKKKALTSQGLFGSGNQT